MCVLSVCVCGGGGVVVVVVVVVIIICSLFDSISGCLTITNSREPFHRPLDLSPIFNTCTTITSACLLLSNTTVIQQARLLMPDRYCMTESCTPINSRERFHRPLDRSPILFTCTTTIPLSRCWLIDELISLLDGSLLELNQLSGAIPSNIGSLVNLQYLYDHHIKQGDISSNAYMPLLASIK